MAVGSACRYLGFTEVPTLCVDHLTPPQACAFRIADNRLTEIGTWDDRLLAQQLKDLSLLGLDFSVELTGFEMAEIDLRITALGIVRSVRGPGRRRARIPWTVPGQQAPRFMAAW
jgi:ParB-like chromosome segregation protein Spo0J